MLYTIRLKKILDLNKFSHYSRAVMTSSSSDSIELGKSAAARMAVEENIHCDCIVGIGSGTTMRYVLESIQDVCRKKSLSVKCIPTSYQSEQLILDYGLPLTQLNQEPIIDITIDGADEVAFDDSDEEKNLLAIKGGGACLLQEKAVASAAKNFVVVADYRKDSEYLGKNWSKGMPIEVLPKASNFVRHQLSSKLNVSLEDLVIRIGREKAGPVITDNGNFIIDWKFKQAPSDWKALSDQVKLIPGVIETGIFSHIIKAAYFGQEDGTVRKKTPGKKVQPNSFNSS